MKFRVDTDKLQNYAGQMNQACKDMRSQNNAYFSAIDALNGMWEGTAHDVFISRCQEDKSQIESLIAVVEQVIDNMKSAASSYETCDSSVAGTFDSIQVG